jgi:hypothetical protein
MTLPPARPPTDREAARTRQRRRRERVRTGKIRLVVEADEIELVDRLTAAGFLHPADADDPAKVAAALLAVVACHA